VADEARVAKHWHGLSQAAAPFNDGTPLASQWPIPPSHFFDYELHSKSLSQARLPLSDSSQYAPHLAQSQMFSNRKSQIGILPCVAMLTPRSSIVSIGEAGTYFYHSHAGFQAVSATSPLIIDSQEPPPYHYDDEKIVFIQDIFSKDFSTIEKGLINNPIVWSGEAAAILVNGKGGGTANGTMYNTSLSIINVEPGKTYRLRVIGATALTFASLAIEGHWDLEVIEADG
jgi:L-ascorbate oxidase